MFCYLHFRCYFEANGQNHIHFRLIQAQVAQAHYESPQAVCVTAHKGSWVKLLLCLISIVTRSSSHLVREVNQTQGSKHCCLFRKTLRKRAISRVFKIS